MTKRIKGIFIHHSASPSKTTSFDDIDRWHKERGWKGCGYNYVIEASGKIVAGREEGSETSGAKGYNDGSYLHICVCGNFNTETLGLHQGVALATLLDHLIDKHSLTYKHLIGHGEAKGAATECPGKNLQAWVNYTRDNHCG